jgi:hypothetical protein
MIISTCYHYTLIFTHLVLNTDIQYGLILYNPSLESSAEPLSSSLQKSYQKILTVFLFILLYSAIKFLLCLCSSNFKFCNSY